MGLLRPLQEPFRRTPQEMFAIERLMREGVRGDTARDLVVSHGAERCLRYAEALDAQEGVRNRASFLVSAIRKGYALPGPPEQHQEPLEPSFESSVIAHDAQRETEQHPPEDPEGFPPPTPDAAADEIWTRALENAEGEIDASSLRVWFGSVTAVALGSESLTISVPTPFAREYIETRFKVALEAALREELSEGAALRVIIHAFRGARIACKLWGLSELPTGRGKPSEGLTGPREGIVVSDRRPERGLTRGS